MILRKLRLQRGWSQSQLAEMAGVTTRTIQRIERGHRPGLETAKALAAVFEVKLSTFLPEDNEMNDPVNSVNDQPTEAQTTEGQAPVSKEEREAMEYAQRVKGFIAAVAMFAVMAAFFFLVKGPSTRLFIIFGSLTLGLIVQGLVTFEVIPFLSPGWEKRLVEKRLGRKF